MKLIISIALLFVSVSVLSQENYTLTIDFEGIKPGEGKLFVALYTSEDDFLKKPLKGTVVEVTNGKAKATLSDLKPGTYAVSSFYDKNNNGKLDTNFLGIPKEPTAMSNNAKGSFGPPKFKDAKFELVADKKIQVDY